MKKTVGVVLFLFILSLTIYSQQKPARDLSWAFPVKNGDLPPEEPGSKTIPGSNKTYPQTQIDDLANPPDWFPEEHAPAPQIVQHGHGDALACGACHLMSGTGHPESADMAGMKAEYIRRQMADFKSGIRKEPNRMNMIAGALSDDEVRQASEWFATLPPKAWTKVVEAAMVPKTFVGGGRMRFAAPGGGMEPIGLRIITLPLDQSRATKRDPHSGFVAYVPPGSIKKGESFVKTGGSGKSVQCAICHGDNLQGLGNVPRIAGLHPIYIARQLYQFKDGSRNGGDAQLMKKPVAQMSDADVLNIAAYVGSLNPGSAK
ncbi:MAG TPA: c-type cytochrome [Terriglobia bacterium]|nr:c-type cytochrome [Terriglobia bacterium]